MTSDDDDDDEWLTSVHRFDVNPGKIEVHFKGPCDVGVHSELRLRLPATMLHPGTMYAPVELVCIDYEEHTRKYYYANSKKRARVGELKNERALEFHLDMDVDKPRAAPAHCLFRQTHRYFCWDRPTLRMHSFHLDRDAAGALFVILCVMGEAEGRSHKSKEVTSVRMAFRTCGTAPVLW